jgi:hypothetical protein
MQHSKQRCVLHWYKWYSGLDGFDHFLTPVEPMTLQQKNRLNGDGAVKQFEHSPNLRIEKIIMQNLSRRSK